jgi:hypothetical protein
LPLLFLTFTLPLLGTVVGVPGHYLQIAIFRLALASTSLCVSAHPNDWSSIFHYSNISHPCSSIHCLAFIPAASLYINCTLSRFRPICFIIPSASLKRSGAPQLYEDDHAPKKSGHQMMFWLIEWVLLKPNHTCTLQVTGRGSTDDPAALLFHSAQNGDISGMETALQLGANVYWSDKLMRMSVLHFAAMCCHPSGADSVRWLLEKGIPWNASNLDNHIPEHLAIMYRNRESAKVLKEWAIQEGLFMYLMNVQLLTQKRNMNGTIKQSVQKHPRNPSSCKS